MAECGWMYQHTNGDLIYKRDLVAQVADIRESPFAVGLWRIDPENRETAWNCVVEALAGGARAKRVAELAEKWSCTDEDAQVYANRVSCVLGRDGDQWYATRVDFIDLQESPAGFGDTCREAMSELCRELGYKPSTMWGATFGSLLVVVEDTDG